MHWYMEYYAVTKKNEGEICKTLQDTLVSKKGREVHIV